jgi:hypothetical protein
MLSLFHFWRRRKKTNYRTCVSKVFSGSQGAVAKLARQSIQAAISASAPNTTTRSEIDNHADTCCFGANFTFLYFMGQVCDISPFSDEYDSMPNVKVCAAATAWDDPITGHTSILEFHQGLWFGSKLPNSLIYPNQCRMFGISLCNDPFDLHRKLKMYDNDETATAIPLAMHGSTCHFVSRVPTKLELDTYPRIAMTSDELWDPASLFQESSSEEEAHTRMVSSIKINQETVDCHPNEPQMNHRQNLTTRNQINCSSVFHHR